MAKNDLDCALNFHQFNKESWIEFLNEKKPSNIRKILTISSFQSYIYPCSETLGIFIKSDYDPPASTPVIS